MKAQRSTCLLAFMVAVAIPGSSSFNIDTANPTVYYGDQKDYFGYKVLQYKSDSKKGVIITAPLMLNGSGGVCNRDKFNDSHDQWFKHQEISFKTKTIPIKRLGLTIAAHSDSEFTVCSPNVAHECDENSYFNSVCYKITHELEQVSATTPSFQECRKKTVDLVFLFDGSASMTEHEFNKNKDFIVDIINNLKNSSIKFAAVQFSTDERKVFDFNDYQAGTALDKLRKEKHMKGLTNTHKALAFVLKEILDNPAAGASPDATKVLVIITDGDPSDTDRDGITKQYQDRNIIRFVIAVKGAKLDKFTAIASKPTEHYAFHIENYDGLTGVLANFQIQIFKMEGTKNASLAQDRKNEMAQTGFSAVVYNDTLILGSVGSNNWRGSLEQMTSDGENPTQIRDPDMQMDSYMGYSVSVGERKNNRVYFSGAPRYEHKGQVVLFTYKDQKWIPAQRLNGDQIGSYFGAELCSVDVDSDGSTDFLLVGAPLFYQPPEKREGQIYVYSLADEMSLKRELNVTVSTMGRFGSTISSVADLNGDGLRDVAVGAPLEDENRGAVYIYLGDRQKGIRSTFSQRIAGWEFEARLRFFGQAIDGRMDLGEDGLPDIVIGSKGTAVVLRSRPVFNVIPHLSFQPEEINIDEIECPLTTQEALPMVNLTVCFETIELTKSKAAAKGSRLNISYTLDLDPTRQTHRGFFNQADKKARSIISAYELMDSMTCFNYSIYMLKCVDTLSPVCIKLNFSQTDSESASAVLNVDSRKLAVVEIPFETQCKKGDVLHCVADLVVDFNFMSPTLLVAEEGYFIVSVKLSNQGEESFNTTITMSYPEGLSFSKMELTEATRQIIHNCYDQEGVLNTTVCGVSLPVFRSRSSATFKTFFRVMTSTNDYEHHWSDMISMTVTGKSKNANTTELTSKTKDILVQFEIKMAVSLKKDAVTYLNFTTDDFKPKYLEIIYKIDNPGWKAFPVDVSLGFPTKLDHNFEMSNYRVSVEKIKTQCNDTSASCSSEPHLKVIRCDPFTLEKESTIEIKLSGDVEFKDLKTHAQNMAFLKRYTGEGAEVKFQSFIHVSYNKTKYVLNAHKQQDKGLTQKRSSGMCPSRENSPTVRWAEVRVEFIIPIDMQLINITGVGLGLLLFFILTVILCKMGCFKRRKLPTDEEDYDFPAGTSAPPVGASQAPDQPAEKKQLLNVNKTNGTSDPPTESAPAPDQPAEESKLLEKNVASSTSSIPDQDMD